MRMRTQTEAYREIKALDPHTALTPYALRQMILSGKIPTVPVGRKRLLDLDKLEASLTAAQRVEAPALERGQIRRII